MKNDSTEDMLRKLVKEEGDGGLIVSGYRGDLVESLRAVADAVEKSDDFNDNEKQWEMTISIWATVKYVGSYKVLRNAE